MKNHLVLGEWNVICDVCGFKFKSSHLKKRWDGKMVCPEDYENRHIQDFRRIPRTEKSPAWTRPEKRSLVTVSRYDPNTKTSTDFQIEAEGGNEVSTQGWGGLKYLSLPGVTGNYASTPDSAILDITGDIDLRARIAPTDWTPPGGVPDAIIAKRNGNTPADSAYEFLLNIDGTLRLQWSTGAAFLSRDSAVFGFTDNSVHWVRVTMDVNDGAGNRVIKFFKGDDGILWEQVGSTATIAGATTIQAHTAPLLLGYDGANVTTVFSGRIYQAQVYNGIEGTLVSDFDASLFNIGGTTATMSTEEVWTVNGASSAIVSAGVIE